MDSKMGTTSSPSNGARPDVKRFWMFFGIGVLYGIVLNFLALVGMGAGHGTIIFYQVAAAPIAFLGYGLGLILSPLYWGLAFALTSYASMGVRLCGRILLIGSYMTVVMWCLIGDIGPSLDTLQAYIRLGFGQIVLVVFALIYGLGQFVAWYAGRKQPVQQIL
jgi:hypothetical protein